MPRGGFRPGAGRPKKGEVRAAVAPAGVKPAEARNWPFGAVPSVPVPVPEPVPFDVPAPDMTLTPLDYLLSLVRDAGLDHRTRMQAASIAAPYVHVKPGEIGKKEAKAKLAKDVAGGKFAPKAPPLALVKTAS